MSFFSIAFIQQVWLHNEFLRVKTSDRVIVVVSISLTSVALLASGCCCSVSVACNITQPHLNTCFIHCFFSRLLDSFLPLPLYPVLFYPSFGPMNKISFSRYRISSVFILQRETRRRAGAGKCDGEQACHLSIHLSIWPFLALSGVNSVCNGASSAKSLSI